MDIVRLGIKYLTVPNRPYKIVTSVIETRQYSTDGQEYHGCNDVNLHESAAEIQGPQVIVLS